MSYIYVRICLSRQMYFCRLTFNILRTFDDILALTYIVLYIVQGVVKGESAVRKVVVVCPTSLVGTDMT
jgi:hypothetical protein